MEEFRDYKRYVSDPDWARTYSAYQKKYANASPPSFDVLVEQHFLRKKFKDPLSPSEDGEFQPLYASTQAGQAGQAAGTLASTTPSGGGIIGVASRNTGQSIRTYNNATHYNEWQFIALQQSQQAGPGAQGQGGNTGRQGGTTTTTTTAPSRSGTTPQPQSR